MPKVKISLFDKIPIKSAFKDENDFSDWLSDNLDAMSDYVDMVLENGQREQHLGDKRADIIAEISDADEKSYVIIENQLGKTDHDHLGKLITYSAIRKAKAAIWIAEKFAPEHIRALNWLNDNTTEERRFYGLVFNVFEYKDNEKKIGFEVLVKPDSQMELIKKSDSGKLKSYHQSRFRLYEKALEEYNKIADKKSGRSATIRRYLNVIRTEDLVFSWSHYQQRENTIEVDVRIRGKTQSEKKNSFDKFMKKLKEIESKIETKVFPWTPDDGKKSNTNYYLCSEFELPNKLEKISEDEFKKTVKWIDRKSTRLNSSH